MPKKTKSNDALAVLGSVRTSRFGADRIDPKRLDLAHTSFRWSARIFQAAMVALAFFFYFGYPNGFLDKIQMRALMTMMTVFSFLVLGTAAFQALMYFARFFGAWSSRKVLIAETATDAALLAYHLAMVIVMLMNRGDKCDNNPLDGCTKYNFAIAWTFFLLFSYIATFSTDILAWIKFNQAAGTGGGYKGTRLNDSETELALRRARMQI